MLSLQLAPQYLEFYATTSEFIIEHSKLPTTKAVSLVAIRMLIWQVKCDMM